MKKLKLLSFIMVLMALTSKAHAVNIQYPSYMTSTTIVSSVTAQVGSQCSLTLSTPTTPSSFSTGYSDFMSHLTIEAYAVQGSTGTFTQNTCTTTNLGGLTFQLPTAIPVGAVVTIDRDFAIPIQIPLAAKSATIVCPALAGINWNLTGTFYQGY